MQISNLFPSLREALTQAFSTPLPVKGVAKKNSSADKKAVGKTSKGATHKVNPTFRSRQIFAVTPAAYRHMHMGKK